MRKAQAPQRVGVAENIGEFALYSESTLKVAPESFGGSYIFTLKAHSESTRDLKNLLAGK